MSSNNQFNEIKTALNDLGVKPTNEAVKAVLEIAQAQNLSLEDAAIAYAESQGKRQTQRVNYQGKTADGYASFAAQASVQQRFQLANELSAAEAEAILEDAAQLTALRVQQDKASGKFTKRVAEHLNLGSAAEKEASELLNQAITAHFTAQEIDSDFFSKSLAGTSSTLLLGAAK